MTIQTPNSTIRDAVMAFNERRWDDAFLLFQNHWLVVRTDECKALAQYANALNQLCMGLTTAPRTMLTRVLVLTADENQGTGVDIQRMRSDAQAMLARVPPDGITAPAIEIPTLQLEWRV